MVRRYGITLLTTLLLAIYTLTNAGHDHIIDETSLFALTESVALRGALDTNAIAWTQWVNSPGEVLGAFASDGQVFSKKGPAPALLAVPWYAFLRAIAQLQIQIGLLQGTLLWNGLLTALTAALLWLTVARLGYSDQAGLRVALLFGLCTIAWPYANHFFGEPLSALCLLTCFYGLISYEGTRRLRWLWLTGVAAGLALATVTAHALLIGIYGLYLVVTLFFPAGDGRRAVRPYVVHSSPLHSLSALGAFAIPILLAAGFLLWYNGVRFGHPLETGYHFDQGEGFTTPPGQGLWGLLVSPYRGLFWHTPLFLLTPVALLPFVRRHRRAGGLIALLSMTLIVLYSTWWMWWGGFAWGPRFLVPMAPLWVLVLAPWVEERGARPSASTGGRGAVVWGWVVAGVAGVSGVVQLLAVVVNYVNYEIKLRELFPTDWRDPLAFGPPAQRLADLPYSPVFGQWMLIREGLALNSDLAWLYPDGTILWLIPLVGGAAILTLALALGSLGKALQTGSPHDLPSRPIRWALPWLGVLVVAVWLGSTSSDPLYGTVNAGYRAILTEVCAEVRPGDAVVTIAPYSYHIPMNWLGGLCDHAPPLFGYAADSMDHPEPQQVLARVHQVYERIWFITGGLPASAPENSVERWLAANAFKADDRWFDDYRLVRYATPGRLRGTNELPLDMFLTDAQGQQVTIWSAQAPGASQPGDLVPVALTYQLDTPVAANLRWFVQLLSPGGVAVVQIDVAPHQGYATFSTLPMGELLVEQVALPLPMDLVPDRYQVIAGLYNPDLPAPNRLLTPTGRDYVLLGTMVVR